MPDLFNDSVLQKLSFHQRRSFVKALFQSFSATIANLSDTKKKELGHNIEDILIECIFNNVECSKEDFVWYYDKLYGNCFTFNSDNSTNEKRVVNRPGKIYGLSLTLFDKMPAPLKRLLSEHGFKIKLDNNIIDSDGIDLLPGVETSVAVTKIISKQLPEPYSSCHIDNDEPENFESLLYKMFLEKNVTILALFLITLKKGQQMLEFYSFIDTI